MTRWPRKFIPNHLRLAVTNAGVLGQIVRLQHPWDEGECVAQVSTAEHVPGRRLPSQAALQHSLGSSSTAPSLLSSATGDPPKRPLPLLKSYLAPAPEPAHRAFPQPQVQAPRLSVSSSSGSSSGSLAPSAPSASPALTAGSSNGSSSSTSPASDSNSRDSNGSGSGGALSTTSQQSELSVFTARTLTELYLAPPPADLPQYWQPAAPTLQHIFVRDPFPAPTGFKEFYDYGRIHGNKMKFPLLKSRLRRPVTITPTSQLKGAHSSQAFTAAAEKLAALVNEQQLGDSVMWIPPYDLKRDESAASFVEALRQAGMKIQRQR